jgi:hypothetical protein
MSRKLIFAGVMAFAAGLAGVAEAQGSGRSLFKCSGKPSVICNFTVFHERGGTKRFQLKGGERRWIAGMRQGDVYCVSKDGGLNERTCKRNRVRVKA